jgi:solute carrier family 10 (sodium/bile acid cotransporter), member 7
MVSLKKISTLHFISLTSMLNWKTIKYYLPDWFIIGIVVVIVLAYLLPGIGTEGSAVELKTIGKYGIMLRFFFYGLKLSPEKLVNDLKNWKMHLTVQLITFILSPLIVLLFYPFFIGSEYFKFWLAVFFLAALPGTVSSSVVMVSIAKGNVPGAIFNASISGVIGIIITPLWMALFFQQVSGGAGFLHTVADLAVQILLPFVIGLILHRFWGKWANRNRKYLTIFDKSIILLIIYESFSASFSNGIFASIPNKALWVLSGSVVALFFLVYYLSHQISVWLKFTRGEQITVVFCGSKKSLVHGSVMAAVIFGGGASASLFLVPIMIYHAFQLFYVSIVARNMGRN